MTIKKLDISPLAVLAHERIREALAVAAAELERDRDHDYDSVVVVLVPHGDADRGFTYAASPGDRYHQYASLHGVANKILHPHLQPE